MLVRFLWLSGLILGVSRPSSARAEPPGQDGAEGGGRIVLFGGWRLTPNDTFYRSASAVGLELERVSPGGPQLSGAFSYPVTRNLDVRIDLFAGGEQLRLAGQPPLQSVTYGGQLGGRLSGPDLFGLGLSPHLAVLLGPTLVYVTGGGLEQPSESLNTGLAAAAGLSWRLSALWCVELEYKHLLVRGAVPGIGSLNGGGNWFSVGVGRFFPP